MLDEDSIEALDKCAKHIKKLTSKRSDIYINITDGFSTITTILNHKLFKHGVNFISYDMFDNEYNILNNYDGLTKHQIKQNLNIADHFLLKGYEVEKYKFKKFANKYETEIKDLFENKHEEYEKFLRLPDLNQTVNYLPSKVSSIKKVFKKMGLEEHHQRNSLLTGGLFEIYIYNLIKDLKYDDIEVGLVVKRECCGSSVANEFDILLMKDNHLHMIECKYMDYSKKNTEALVYKYIALSEVIDEDGKMIMLVKNNLNKDPQISYEQNLSGYERRAKLNNITFKGAVHKKPALFSMHVKNIFGL
jgi:hypothetical protein